MELKITQKEAFRLVYLIFNLYETEIDKIVLWAYEHEHKHPGT